MEDSRQFKYDKNVRNKYRWLKIFQELVPSSDDEVTIEEKDEEMKFMVHGTQFTDHLKYTEFTRYSEDQLGELKEQISELNILNKIPPMVTMAEKDPEEGEELGKQAVFG
jgi:2-phospho-L-lactate transferase/gluconeogenesis factor (CofD/UPF0052 family)